VGDFDDDGIPDNEDLDDDNDGVKDTSDAFPFDPTEWADNDDDGLGDNTDPDDDNDGTPDAEDAFPYDITYQSDTDSDGMPDLWESQNGLDANDASDAGADPDQDEFSNLDEFIEGTDPQVADAPAQIVYIERAGSVIPGKTTSVTVKYTTSDGNENVTGLGLKVHYDSTFATVSVADLAGSSIGNADYADIEDWDNDPATDRYVLVSWLSFTGEWPGSALPLDLIQITVATDASIEALEAYTIRFSSNDLAEGYRLIASPIVMPVVSASLDIDGDGQAKALTDGLLIIRRLFGFSGNSLVAGAVSVSATVTAAGDIADRIDAFRAGLDIDGDGQTKALTDGLLIIRRLFGFSGTSLVAGAVSGAATRTDPTEIADYIDSLKPGG